MKMKSTFIISLVFLAFGCQSSAPKQESATTANVVIAEPVVVQKNSVVGNQSPIPCTRKGNVVEKFEQNNAVFERIQDEEIIKEWMKITTKDGKCFTIDSLSKENHHSITFEDWDKDGMKDRIDNWKWDYEVALFDKTSNKFSRHIAGRFNGEQWDFDKSQNLKFQFLENKMGGVYELYKLVGANKKVLSLVDYVSDQEGTGNDKIEIHKNIVIAGDASKFDVVPMDSKLLADTKVRQGEDYEIHLERIKKAVEAYWHKNLPVFMK